MSNPSSRPHLCVSMIVRNEQAVLVETLASVREIADEILVLDTGSTDQTPSIAAEWGATVSHLPWSDDFSAARNHLLDQAQSDWILWLDAGERLDNESARQLRDFVDHQADPSKLYYLFVQLPAAEPSGSAEQAARPRLMPRNPRLRFEMPVGESVRASADLAGLSIGAAPGRITCHARRHDPAWKKARATRDLKIIAAYRGRGNALTPRLLIVLGEAYSDVKQPVLAEQAFLEALYVSTPGSTEMLEAYYGLLTTLALDPTQRDRQLLTCTDALKVYPFDAQLLSTMGGQLQSRRRLDLAERCFQTAIQHGQVNPETWHLVELPEMVAVCLSLTLQLRGKDDEARRVLTDAFGRSPTSLRVRRQLLDLEIKHGREEEALRLAQAGLPDDDASESLRRVVRGACQAARQQWPAAIDDLQAAYAAGHRDLLCLRWLSVTLLSTGQVEAAAPVLRQWHDLEPDNREVQTYLSALRNWPEGMPSAPELEKDAQERVRKTRTDKGEPTPAGTPEGLVLSREPAMRPEVETRRQAPRR